MIAFISICYAGIVWLLAFKLRVVPWNSRTQMAAGSIYVVFILALVIAMNLYQPYSTDLRVYARVAELVPRVSGRVIEVVAKPNTPLRKGEVIYRIDPRPYEYAVARLEAELQQAETQLKLAKLELDRTTAAARTAAVSQSEVDTWRARAASAQAAISATQAQLDNARFDLAETVVYAPADGLVPNLPLTDGQIAGATAFSSLVPFLDTKSIILVASFRQSSMPHIQRGDVAEVAFDQHPGRVFEARVVDLIAATGQGQLEPSGTLQQWSQPPTPGNFGVRLELADASPSTDLTVGASGAAAIYTQRGASIRIIRKVIIRIYSWLNYL